MTTSMTCIWTSISRDEQRILLPLILMISLSMGCDPVQLIGGSKRSLKSELQAARSALNIPLFEAGSDTKRDLKRIAARSLTSKLGRLIGRQQSIRISVELSSDSRLELSLQDTLTVGSDAHGNWFLEHQTSMTEAGEKDIHQGRRCLFSENRFFTGHASGPMKAYADWIDEPERCLNSAQDILLDVFEVFLDQVSLELQSTQSAHDDGLAVVTLGLEAQPSVPPAAVPIAWPAGPDRSDAIWGPRRHLIQTRTRLEGISGTFTIEKDSGLFVEAQMELTTGIRKAAKSARMRIKTSLETSVLSREIVTPADAISEDRRQRIFRDRKILLGLDLPKNRDRSSSLPAPGDAPPLVLSETGSLTTDSTTPTDSKPGSIEDQPSADDYDEDLPQ